MTLPTVITRIAFASEPMADAPSWTTLSGQDVMRFQTRRGRNHELDRVQAGIATFILNNDNDKYWPDLTTGPYYDNIKPGKRVNIRATYDGNTYDLYTGFVDKWTPSFRSLSGKGAIISVSCLDAQNNLARYLLNNAGEALELSGTRVGNVADEIGFPAADRALDTGQSQMIATGAQANVNAMDHLFTVQDSEYGIMFIAGNGYLTFHDRHHRLVTAECNTSQATFGNDPTERRFVDIVLDMDAKDVLNDVRITRSGGTEQTASDSTSQDTYGKRSLSRTGLLMPSDAEADSQANYILSRYKDGALRVKALVIRPQGDPTNLWPKVLSYDIGYRITLNLDRAGISKDYHIEGISHSVDSQTGTWETRWELSDADSQNYWILDTSELDTNTRLAY